MFLIRIISFRYVENTYLQKDYKKRSLVFSEKIAKMRQRKGPVDKPVSVGSPRKVFDKVVQLPTMRGTITRRNYEYCTPLSAFTPVGKTLIKQSAMRNKQELRVQPDKEVDPECLSLIFDRRMNNIEKEPHKIIQNLLQKNAIALRIGYGTVVRIDGML